MSNSSALEAAHNDAITSPPQEPAQSCPKKSWIEIRLLDENGKPVPREEYKIIAPGGREVTGALDSNGFARVEGLDPGQCQVTFPRLHHNEWDPK